MAVKEMKEQVKDIIDQLSEEDLEVILPVARRLTELKATEDILEDEEMTQRIAEGLKDIEAGQTKNWREVSRD